jgi:hypothetical protein
MSEFAKRYERESHAAELTLMREALNSAASRTAVNRQGILCTVPVASETVSELPFEDYPRTQPRFYDVTSLRRKRGNLLRWRKALFPVAA